MDFGKPTEMSHLAYSILLPQLHCNSHTYHLYTVALTGLADWSAFIDRVSPKSHDLDNETHGGH